MGVLTIAVGVLTVGFLAGCVASIYLYHSSERISGMAMLTFFGAEGTALTIRMPIATGETVGLGILTLGFFALFVSTIFLHRPRVHLVVGTVYGHHAPICHRRRQWGGVPRAVLSTPSSVQTGPGWAQLGTRPPAQRQNGAIEVTIITEIGLAAVSVSERAALRRVGRTLVSTP